MVMAVLPTAVSHASKNETTSDNDRRKASFAYYEALRQRERNNVDAFFELLRYAHQLDPNNSVVSYYLGFCYVTMGNSTRDVAEEGYRLMKEHFDAKPTDYDESLVYANVASRLGHDEEAVGILDTLVKLFPGKLEVRAMLANAYARNGQFREAIATYDTLETYSGKSLNLSLRKINFYMTLNDTAGIIGEGRRLFQTAPDNATYNLLLGTVLMQVEQNDSAMKYIDRAQQLDPENGMTYLTKAQLFYNQGDSVNYDRQIYHALVSKNLDVANKVEVLTDYVRQMIAERDSSQRAENLFDVLLSQHPHEKAIHELYSQYFFTQNNYERAIEQMEYVTDIDPSSANNWMRLLFLDIMAEDYTKAVGDAQKAIEYNPDSVELYTYVAPIYYQVKDYDKALGSYRKALELADSTDYVLRSSLMGGMGDAYSALNDTTQAINCYEEALKLDPGNSLVMNNLAYFLAVRNIDLDRAERLSAQAVKEEPESATVLDTYAWVFFRKKEYKLALAYIEKAIEYSEEDTAEIIEHYGDILFMNGRFDEAVENWERALELNPESEILRRKVENRTYFNE